MVASDVGGLTYSGTAVGGTSHDGGCLYPQHAPLLQFALFELSCLQFTLTGNYLTSTSAAMMFLAATSNHIVYRNWFENHLCPSLRVPAINNSLFGVKSCV